MNVLDPCPDDLLARAPEAPLAAAERAQLTAHLGRCPICRTAAEVTAAVREEPVALPGDELLIARLVARAAGLVTATEAAATTRTPYGRGRPARAAAGIVLVAVAAAASMWLAPRLLRRPAPVPAMPRATAPAAPVIAETPSTVTPAPSPTTEKPREEAPSLAPKAARKYAAPATADGLLAQARAARARGDKTRALELYRRVTRLAPGSPAATVADIAIGILLLEPGARRDARSALNAFDRYLATAPAGPLREEAIVGRARALEMVGEPARAIAAWHELLDHHPRSLHAPLARRRLQALRAELPAGETP